MAVHSAPIEKTIRALLDSKKYQTLKDVLVTWEPADLAAILGEVLSRKERVPHNELCGKRQDLPNNCSPPLS